MYNHLLVSQYHDIQQLYFFVKKFSKLFMIYINYYSKNDIKLSNYKKIHK